MRRKTTALTPSQIMTEILRHYDAGQLVYERPFAKRLYAHFASAAPEVHDALLRLEAHGLIMKDEGKIKGGWRIISHSLRAQGEMLLMRRSLLQLALETLQDAVSTHRTGTLLVGLYRHVERLRELVRKRGLRTHDLIDEHANFLVEVANVAEMFHVRDQLRVIQDRLAVCRIVYPTDLSMIVDGAAGSTGDFVGAGCQQLLDAVASGDAVEPVLRRHLAFFEQWNREACKLAPTLCDDAESAKKFANMCWPMTIRLFQERRTERETLPKDLDVATDMLYRDSVVKEFQNSLRASQTAINMSRVDEAVNLPILVYRTALVVGHLRVSEKDRKPLHTYHIFNSLIRQAGRTRLSEAEYHALVLWRLLQDKGSVTAITDRISRSLDIDAKNVRFTLLRARKQLENDLPAPLLYLLSLERGMQQFFGRPIHPTR